MSATSARATGPEPSQVPRVARLGRRSRPARSDPPHSGACALRDGLGLAGTGSGSRGRRPREVPSARIAPMEPDRSTVTRPPPQPAWRPAGGRGGPGRGRPGRWRARPRAGQPVPSVLAARHAGRERPRRCRRPGPRRSAISCHPPTSPIAPPRGPRASSRGRARGRICSPTPSSALEERAPPGASLDIPGTEGPFVDDTAPPMGWPWPTR